MLHLPNKIALSLHGGLVILHHYFRAHRLERALAWMVGAIEQGLDLTEILMVFSKTRYSDECGFRVSLGWVDRRLRVDLLICI